MACLALLEAAILVHEPVALGLCSGSDRRDPLLLPFPGTPEQYLKPLVLVHQEIQCTTFLLWSVSLVLMFAFQGVGAVWHEREKVRGGLFF